MACPHPLTAYRLKQVESSDGKIIQWTKPRLPEEMFEEVKIPCGQCVECRLAYARNWAVRLEHENQMHDQSAFLTLTYDDEHLQYTRSGLPTLNYKDMQSFIKRLRRRLDAISEERRIQAEKLGLPPPPPIRIRFFYSGEYGETTFRPHFHMVLFGWFPADAKYLKKSSSYPLFTSALLDDCWRQGYVWIGRNSFDTFAYVAGYVLKKFRGSKEERDRFYRGRQPERSVMSRRPGIALNWFNKYKGDVFPTDEVVTSKGFVLRPCKYYTEKFLEGLSYEKKRSFLEIRKASFDARPVSIARLLAREERHKAEQRQKLRDVR